MDKVNKREIQCLVSTTVVEVGINNPNATVMVIENAERFGYSKEDAIIFKIGEIRELSKILK